MIVPMVGLRTLVKFCNDSTLIDTIKDFHGSWNGLQLENNGEVTKIGAAVDAGLVPFMCAAEKKIDFLLVHHGLFWTPPTPLTGVNYKKIKYCMDNNIAVYSSHLPLDCHPKIGNNAILAQKLGLVPNGSFLPYEGNDIGLLAKSSVKRTELRNQLKDLFPKGITAMEFGSEHPQKIALLTGSGQSAVDKILGAGTDTLITGELKQHHFNMAQELKLNLYACGHYATETFGVDALAQEVAEKFDLPYEFIPTECTL